METTSTNTEPRNIKIIENSVVELIEPQKPKIISYTILTSNIKLPSKIPRKTKIKKIPSLPTRKSSGERKPKQCTFCPNAGEHSHNIITRRRKNKKTSSTIDQAPQQLSIPEIIPIQSSTTVNSPTDDGAIGHLSPIEENKSDPVKPTTPQEINNQITPDKEISVENQSSENKTNNSQINENQTICNNEITFNDEINTRYPQENVNQSDSQINYPLSPIVQVASPPQIENSPPVGGGAYINVTTDDKNPNI